LKTTRFKFLRGTTAQRLAIVLLEAEVIYDKTLAALYYGDGVTAGGLPFTAVSAQVSQAVNTNTTITNQDYIRVYGASPVTITVPASAARELTIKNTSTAVVTIVPPSGLINNNANIQIRAMTGASLGNSVVLFFEGSQWWVK
jgi:hypothetical protein